jgi:hypothetical protein
VVLCDRARTTPALGPKNGVLDLTHALAEVAEANPSGRLRQFPLVDSEQDGTQPPLDDLNELERRLVDAVAAGTPDPVSPDKIDEDVPSGGQWQERQTVRASVLAALCRAPGCPDTIVPAVRLAHARIAGPLDLTGATLVSLVELRHCFCTDPLILDQATALSVRLHGCIAPLVSARQLETRGDLELSGLTTRRLVLQAARIGGVLSIADCDLGDGVAGHADEPTLDASALEVRVAMVCDRLQVRGMTRLTGARINGPLMFAGAQLNNPGGQALRADRLIADGGMFCQTSKKGDRFEAHGEICLLGAQIDAQVRFVGALLDNPNPKGAALNADRIVVGGMYCLSDKHGEPFEAHGEIRLLGAQINGQLGFGGALLKKPDGRVLSARGLRVEDTMFCHSDKRVRFEADGTIHLPGARINGELEVEGALLSNAESQALNLEGAVVNSLSLRMESPPLGLIDLTDAAVQRFSDRWRCSGPDQAQRGPDQAQRPYRLVANGFVYERLAPDSSKLEDRLDWAAAACEDGYVPQVYDELAAVFGRAGRDDAAQRVLIEKQRARRRRRSSLATRAASCVFDWTVGYGYRTWRAAVMLLAVIGGGWLVFSLAHPNHMRLLTEEHRHHAEFSALMYSIDAVLPVISLGQTSTWSATGWAAAWYVFSAIIGWALGLGFVAYLTARLFRQ